MLKYNVTNEDFEQLPDTIKEYYEQSDDGYTLKVDGVPTYAEQVKGLKDKINELQNEAKRSKDAKRKAEEEAEAELARIQEAEARKKGDFEQLLNSSEQKRQELEQQLTDMRNNIAQQAIDAKAAELANKIASSTENAELLKHFVKQRIRNSDDGIKVTDESGNITISSLEDLQTEFVNNQKFAALIAGNQASGGGATGANGGAVIKPLSEMTEPEKVKLFKEDRAKFEQLQKQELNKDN